jgi:porin
MNLAKLVRGTVGAIAIAPLVAHAQAGEPLDSVAQESLTGDWKERRWLAERGVSLSAHFIAQPGVNDAGIHGSGTTWDQQLDFGAVLDLATMGVADAGTVRFVLSDRFGHAVNVDRTGAYIQNQAYYGQGQNFRFDELSYERGFLAHRLSLKGGFYSMGNDFAGLPTTCNFTNNGNCGHPLGLLYGSGWVDSPTGQWGGRAKWTDPLGWYAELGAYDVAPQRKQRSNGFDTSIGDNTGLIVPLEIGYVHGKSPDDYFATYKFGVYRDSSNTRALGEASHVVDHRTGGYLQGVQQVWKPRPGVVQGISVFGIATLNDRSTGLFRTTYEAGASWRGVVESRGDDILGLGWVRLNVQDGLRHFQAASERPVQQDEQMVELNYGIQATPWLLIRPTVQYVIRPGAYDTRPDTSVFVLHMQATL